MRLNEFTFIFAKSLNPGDYKLLVTRKKRDTLKYFFLLLFLSILLGFILSTPKIVSVPNKIETFLAKFESFNISKVDVQANEKIVLLEFPKTVIDFTGNQTNITDEIILITKSDIMWKKVSPSLFGWRVFETNTKPIEEYSDVISNFGNIKGGTYWLLFILFIPSVFLFIYMFNLLKYVFLIGLVTFIGYFVVKIKRKKTSLFGVWKTAVFSSTIMVFIDMAIAPLFKFNFFIGVLPLLLYILMFILAMLVISEKEIEMKRKHEKYNDD